ncbi:MAG: hypothetical protein ABJM36_09090 [Algibacter sp.]|uniref:hypothetical protein n=1 Tax=Algibacter sp. TaxID=1872428 RepID=UPI00329A7B14
MKKLSRLLTFCAVMLILGLIACKETTTKTVIQKVKVYPAPEGIELSKNYKVSVESENVPVYTSKIPPNNPIPRLNPNREDYD